MDVVVTGPDPYPIHMGSGLKQAALHHQEADVLMVYHAILESSNGHKNTRVVSDDTGVLRQLHVSPLVPPSIHEDCLKV